MDASEEKDGHIRSQPLESLESPFLSEEIFTEENEETWDASLSVLEAENLFQHAFESTPEPAAEPEVYREEFNPEDDETEKSYPAFFSEPEEDEGDSFLEKATIGTMSDDRTTEVPYDEEDATIEAVPDTEQQAEAAGLSVYTQPNDGQTFLTAGDFLQYLEDLVDEEVFDEEAESAQTEWQAYPTLHIHFSGKSPNERFATYVELRPLYQQATGVDNPAQWIAENIITCSFFGHRTPAHRDLRTPLAAAENALRAEAFTPAIHSFWGFVPRRMRRRAKLSNHALGRAIDIDHKTNPHIYKKEDILVIREATGIDLGRKQKHDSMRRASHLFQQTFNQQWEARQTGEVRKAVAKRREVLDKYARQGFLNIEQRIIDALLNAGFTWGGDWRSEKDFMHFELPTIRRAEPAGSSTVALSSSRSNKPTADLIRFVQQVLNAAEGERLAVDGDLGPRTRGALERFRQKHDLGAGAALDEKTAIALTQRALEEIRQQSLFGQLGVLDAATRTALVTFKSKHGLRATATLDAVTRAALTDVLAKQIASSPSASMPAAKPQQPTIDGPLNKVVQVASESEIARYPWLNRGVAPRGYIKGMALVYARVYCKLEARNDTAWEMARANTGNGYKDALAHYAKEFEAAGMNNDTAGVDTLRHLFVLLVGLGMRESSGRYCAGRDTSASNIRSETAEAGLFQTSYNARGANPLMPRLFSQYLANPSGFLDIFREGVVCKRSDLQNFGEGMGREFQRLSKECPAFAAEFAAVGLRNRRRHWGPINRKTAEIRPECDAMLLQVQRIVDEFKLCPLVL